jgi:hypothetical protein
LALINSKQKASSIGIILVFSQTYKICWVCHTVYPYGFKRKIAEGLHVKILFFLHKQEQHSIPVCPFEQLRGISQGKAGRTSLKSSSSDKQRFGTKLHSLY